VWEFYTNTAATPDFFGRFGFKFEGGINNAARQFQLHVADNTTPRFVVNGSGNVLINTTTDAGFRLDVNGTARVQGLMRSTEVFVIGGTATTNTANARFWSTGGQAPTSGFFRALYADTTWIPSSGNAEYYALDLRFTINQTGTATGVTRGLYIAPTVKLTISDGTRTGGFNPSAGLDAFSFGTSSNHPLVFATNNNAVGRIATTGNWLINTTTDAGFKLDVNGTARVRGASNLSTTTAFTIANSDSTTLLQVQDNGYIRIGSQGTSAFRVYATDASGDSEPSGLHLVLNSRVVSSATPAGIGMVMLNGINGTATTGTQNVFLISKGFAPTSGTATYSSSVIIPTINQTGGANGITRGLYINPTLTSAADFRAIETTAGRVVFGNLPTSSAGLPTGAIWNDGGTLKIV